MLAKYAVEVIYTHKDWSFNTSSIEDFVAASEDEAERKCKEYIEREGYKVVRIERTNIIDKGW